MTEHSDRFKLPFILPGQAQKEVFHNEALAAIDALLHPVVEAGPLSVPPANPQLGQAWIVGGLASGSWTGKEHMLAAWTDGGWRFMSPGRGMLVWNRADGHWIHWNGTQWREGELSAAMLVVNGKKVVGERQPAVPSPSGGTIIDAEARAAIAAITAALKSHGLTE